MNVMDVLNDSTTTTSETFARDGKAFLYERRSHLPVSAAEAWDWHSRPGALERLVPPWQRLEIQHGAPRLEEGSRVTLKMWKGPVPFTWLAEHRKVEPGRGFEDVQIDGPFALWEHRHEMLDNAALGAPGGCTLVDRIRFAPPGGALGRMLAARMLRSDLERTFAYRHHTTRDDLAFHARHAETPRLRVAISGASGLVGRALAAMLSTGGHEVVRLVRRPPRRPEEAQWDPERGLIDPAALGKIDAVVHLAGENISKAFFGSGARARIRRSRVEGTYHLVDSLADLEHPPKTLICASAIGFHGDTGDTEIDETSPSGEGFLAEVCREWEEAAAQAERFGVRVCSLRFGLVLSPAGGALASMLPAFRAGAGGRVGDGRQFISWISIEDAAAAIVHALLTDALVGPVLAVSPGPRRQRELADILGTILHRPTFLPLPAPLLRLALGSMADETLLASTRAVPRALLSSGFVFRHPELEPALRHLLGAENGAEGKA